MVDESGNRAGDPETLEADLVDQSDLSDTPLVSDTSKPVTPYYGHLESPEEDLPLSGGAGPTGFAASICELHSPFDPS